VIRLLILQVAKLGVEDNGEDDSYLEILETALSKFSTTWKNANE
jgi:hypothetical protein